MARCQNKICQTIKIKNIFIVAHYLQINLCKPDIPYNTTDVQAMGEKESYFFLDIGTPPQDV